MWPKNIALALFLGLLSACASQQPQKLPKEQILFENIALAICLGAAADHASEKADVNGSAMGYFERSHLPPEALEHIRSVSAEWLNNNTYKDTHSKSCCCAHVSAHTLYSLPH